ncbi:hypothetical protein TNCV_1701121 [Trichonephila clavipes]|nr:hypothetical protein TNCV_1701121 [Trichonephila clavipes]
MKSNMVALWRATEWNNKQHFGEELPASLFDCYCSTVVRLPVLRSQSPLLCSNISSLAASSVRVIAFCFPSKPPGRRMLGGRLAVARSAAYFTIGHPESELTTAKENPKCSK